jgi:hypothetical protein
MISWVRPYPEDDVSMDSVFSLEAPILIRTPFSTRLGAVAVDTGGTSVAVSVICASSVVG